MPRIVADTALLGPYALAWRGDYWAVFRAPDGAVRVALTASLRARLAPRARIAPMTPAEAALLALVRFLEWRRPDCAPLTWEAEIHCRYPGYQATIRAPLDVPARQRDKQAARDRGDARPEDALAYHARSVRIVDVPDD